MKPEFSEFSYGFAFTNEITSHLHLFIKGAPLFPSLSGESLLGYDVKLPIIGYPMFFQYKLSSYLTRPYANEWSLFSRPYRRIRLYNSLWSAQHNTLVSLESHDNIVLYAAPGFHKLSDFNAHYNYRTIMENSFCFTPSSIGRYPRDEEHYVVFHESDSFGYFCSNRKKRIEVIFGKRLKEYLADNTNNRKPIEIDKQFIRDLISKLINIVHSESNIMLTTDKDSIGTDPLGYLIGITRVVLGGEFVICLSRLKE